MSDILFGNNNSGVIRRITKNSLSANKLRNRFIGAVIILSAFLLSFSSTFVFNAALDLRNTWQEMNVDGGTALSEAAIAMIAIAVIVFLACVLAVYNIFYISIARRINEYGRLRTIGATSKQIGRIVRLEGIILSARYIPFGVIPGCLASYIISPAGWHGLQCLTCAIASGLITFMTVFLSVIKPARFAASVSPIEAAGYNGYSQNDGKTTRASRRLSPATLGIANICRHKKKTIFTFLSLVFSGILFIGAASVMNAVNPAERAKEAFKYGGEYQISFNRDLLSPTVDYNDLQADNPLTDVFMTQVLEIDGVDGVVAYKYIRCTLSENTDIFPDINGMQPQDADRFHKYLIAGSLDGDGIVLNKSGLYVEKNDGVFGIKEDGLYNSSYGRPYMVGDEISLILKDGRENIEMSFEICGMIDNKNDGSILYLPAHVIDKIMNANCNTDFEILSDKGYSIETANALKSLVQNDERLSITLLDEEIAYFKSIFHVITAVLYAFVALVGVFAIVNLINTIITNALSRKTEIGIMQAVGLDKKQFRQMLRVEHSVMLLGSFIVSLLFGGYGGYVLCNTLSNIGGLSFVRYSFPVWQIAAYFALIIAIQVMLTTILDKSMSKQSIVARIYQ
jgi:putative ABC transport system permease protein